MPPATPRLGRESAGFALNILYHRALTHLRQVSEQDSPVRHSQRTSVFTSPTRPSPSLFLSGIATSAVRTTQQDHPSWLNGLTDGGGQLLKLSTKLRRTHQLTSNDFDGPLDLLDGAGQRVNLISQPRNLGGFLENADGCHNSLDATRYRQHGGIQLLELSTKLRRTHPLKLNDFSLPRKLSMALRSR